MKLMKRPSSGRKSLTVHREELAATILDCLIDGASDEFGQKVRLLLFLAALRHVIPNMLSLVAESNWATRPRLRVQEKTMNNGTTNKERWTLIALTAFFTILLGAAPRSKAVQPRHN